MEVFVLLLLLLGDGWRKARGVGGGLSSIWPQ